MELHELNKLKVLADGLTKTDSRSDGASLSVGEARELGWLIMEVLRNGRDISRAYLKIQNEVQDMVLVQEHAEKVAKNCADLIQERDSLKAKLREMGECLLKQSTEKVQLEEERDSLKSRLAAADELLGQSRANEENACNEVDRLSRELDRYRATDGPISSRAFVELSQERDSFRSDALRFEQGFKSVCEERDSLKETLAQSNKALSEKIERVAQLERSPLVKFALELERANREAAAKLGGVA